MQEYQVSLPKTVYQRLVKVAEQEGMTPRDWIASKVSSFSVSSEDSFQSVDDLIGSIASHSEPQQKRQKTAFGEKVATKLAKQGLRRP